MKIYGRGTLRAPGTSRPVWDFAEDGIFNTDNAALVGEAMRRGFAVGEDAVKAFEAEHAPPVRAPEPVQAIEPAGPEPVTEAPNAPRRGRPRKEATV